MTRREGESGFISIWAMILAWFIFLGGVALAYVAFNEQKMSAELVTEARLRLAAESAAEHVAAEIEPQGVLPLSELRYSETYTVSYGDVPIIVTIKVENARDTGGLLITSVAVREGVTERDWDRSKVRRAIMREKEGNYVWSGWRK